MLTDWKVSCLVCKFVFYRPEHNAMVEPVELNIEVLKRKTEI